MTQPNEPPELFQAFTPYERFSLLVHGAAKAGKSTLAATAPLPILVLDVEDSWRFVPLRKVYWNPMTEQPPIYDGTWDVCHVNVTDWQTLQTVYTFLTGYRLPFVSVCIDSITEAQSKLKANLVGTESLKIQDWGVVLTKMDDLIRSYRDLPTRPGLNVRCVVFVAETRLENNKWRPYMQGQISVKLPYTVDVCSYLYREWVMDANGQALADVRRLWVDYHPQYETGQRVQGMLGQYVEITQTPDGVIGQDITNMMHRIYRHGTPVPAAANQS